MIPSSIHQIVKALEDKKGINIRVLDVRDLVSYTDFLIVCTGSSRPHVGALISNVEDSILKGAKPIYVNTSKDDSWWILDFVDVVVHVFQEEARLFYDLERLWCDAKTVAI